MDWDKYPLGPRLRKIYSDILLGSFEDERLMIWLIFNLLHEDIMVRVFEMENLPDEPISFRDVHDTIITLEIFKDDPNYNPMKILGITIENYETLDFDIGNNYIDHLIKPGWNNLKSRLIS